MSTNSLEEEDDMFVVGKACLDRVQKTFDGADKSKDGTINILEAMRLLTIEPRLHGRILNVMDASGKKALDIDDFNRMGILAVALEAFQKYDKNKDFKLDEIEFHVALWSLGIPDQEVSRIFDDADKDDSKYLSQTEFIDEFLRLLLKADDFGYVESDDDDDDDDDDEGGGGGGADVRHDDDNDDDEDEEDGDDDDDDDDAGDMNGKKEEKNEKNEVPTPGKVGEETSDDDSDASAADDDDDDGGVDSEDDDDDDDGDKGEDNDGDRDVVDLDESDDGDEDDDDEDDDDDDGDEDGSTGNGEILPPVVTPPIMVNKASVGGKILDLLETMFRDIDDGDKGTLTRRQLERGLQRGNLKRWCDVSALTNYYRRTKKGEDFVVQREEFINAALLQCAKEEFRKRDINNNKSLSKEELNTLLLDFGFSASESDAIFAKVAKDASKGISEMEFLTLVIFYMKPAPGKKKRVKVELTDEDFEDVHEEIVLKDSIVEVHQRNSVIVYLKIRIRRNEKGVNRISTIVLPAKLSGSLLTEDEEEEEEDEEDEDVAKMYETDSNFYSLVSGVEQRIDVALPQPLQLPANATVAFVSLQLPVRVVRLDGETEQTLVDLPLKITVEDAPNDFDAQIKEMVSAVLG